MSREALVLLVCCCDFRDGAERLIPSKSLRNAVIRAFPGLFRILRMCAPRRAAAVVRPRGREKSADRRRRILISRLLIIRASVPRRKSPFPAYFKGFPAVSPLIPPYPTFLKYPVSPQMPMTTEQWERENQDTLMEYFIDGDPSVRRIQCEYCRKVIYTQTRNRKYCSFQTCGHKMLNLRKSLKKRVERGKYTCACCGKQFLPIRADARYCSNACRQKDYRHRKTAAHTSLLGT